MSTIEDTIRDLARTQMRSSPVLSAEVPAYETGSFVPTWVGGTIAGTFTYNANATLVEWTRIGNRVEFNGRIAITAIGVAPTGVLQIAGWPYPGVAATNMAIAGGGSIFYWTLNIVNGYTQVGMQFANGSSLAVLTETGDNLGPAAVLGGELIVGDTRFFGQYRIV